MKELVDPESSSARTLIKVPSGAKLAGHQKCVGKIESGRGIGSHCFRSSRDLKLRRGCWSVPRAVVNEGVMCPLAALVCAGALPSEVTWLEAIEA